ncbi:MAG TPA: DUF2806 domain-containing protein, partial [Phormidium sp.]
MQQDNTPTPVNASSSNLMRALRSSLGWLSDRQIDKRIHSQEYREKALKDAQSKIATIHNLETTHSAVSRAEERATYLNTLHLLNTEAIISFADQNLSSNDSSTQHEEHIEGNDNNAEPESKTENHVDPDWISRLFSIAEEVSNENMQRLWGHILAGEVRKPGSYSLRTLEVLRNLTQSDAMLFQKIANFVLTRGDDKYIYRGKNTNDGILPKYGISHNDINRLIYCDLLLPDRQLGLCVYTGPVAENIMFEYQNMAIILNGSVLGDSHPLLAFSLSDTGKELYRLIQTTINFEYISEVAEFYKETGLKVQHGM